MTRSKIEWTARTWNPTRGCSRVSEGCRNCYAEHQAARLCGSGEPFEGFVESKASGPRWTGRVELVPARLEEPLRWRKPARVFVNSMSDLFHEAVPFEIIAAIFGVMAASPRLTFQVLTKRPRRAVEFFGWIKTQRRGYMHGEQRLLWKCLTDLDEAVTRALEGKEIKDEEDGEEEATAANIEGAHRAEPGCVSEAHALSGGGAASGLLEEVLAGAVRGDGGVLQHRHVGAMAVR